ncbi:MAG: Rieske 2Fe-2S domain-containing protein [Thermoplasmata archaeon]|nr:Rieske 2Fe-2S domain-containing protein [Thermoplasmata archaeon]
MTEGPTGLATGAEDCGNCPSAGGQWYTLAPYLNQDAVGVVRRVAPLGSSGPPGAEAVDEARRNLIKLALIGGAIAVGAAGGATALRYLEPPVAGASSYPKVQLLYDDGSPILGSQYRYPPGATDLIVFNYPLTNEPNILFNLPAAAPNGVGPKSTLVAYSAICQHLGCVPPYVSYYPPGACPSFNGGKAIIHCVCHGSTYDPAQAATGGGAAILTGPTQLPLPQVLLEWDSATDYLFAVGVIGPPVRGHSNTLLGGSPVSSPLQLEAPQSPTQQCPT